jgi:O-antigen ligase
MNNDEGLSSQFTACSWPQRLVLLLAALFPLVSVSVRSGGSVLFTLLVLPALFYAWPERKALDAAEKRWLLAYLSLFVLAAVSLLYVDDLQVGLGKLERYLRLALLGVIYLFLRRMSVEAGRFFLFGVVAAAFSLGGQAWYQIQVQHQDIASGLYHKIVFGDMAVLTFTVMLAAALTVARRPWDYLLLASAMTAALYASLMSATRGSWLLLPLLALLLAWLYRDRIGRRGWVAALAAVALLAGAMAFWQPRVIMAPMSTGVHEIERYLENPKQAGSWGARLEMWGNSIKIWRKNPWFGTGIGDFQHDSKELVASGQSKNRLVAREFGHAHSIYFDALASLGGVGLLVLVLALFVLPWRHFSRRWREAVLPWERFYALSGLLTVAAFAEFGLTEGWTSRNPFVNPYIIYIAVFASSLAVSAARRVDRRLPAQ